MRMVVAAVPDSADRFGDQLQYLARVGVAIEGFLREHQRAVDLHFEHSAGRFQQLDIAVGKRLLQFRRQTGGAWLVVSDDAVFDGDFHARASRIETGTAGPFNRSPGQG